MKGKRMNGKLPKKYEKEEKRHERKEEAEESRHEGFHDKEMGKLLKKIRVIKSR
jgi:hypothetical protein